MDDSAGGNGLRVARTVAVMGALACTASLLLAHVHPFGNADLYGARDANTHLLATSSLPRTCEQRSLKSAPIATRSSRRRRFMVV
jgi:hypothetical protein